MAVVQDARSGAGVRAVLGRQEPRNQLDLRGEGRRHRQDRGPWARHLLTCLATRRSRARCQSDEVVIYVVNALNRHFNSRTEAEAEIKAAREADPEGARGPYDIVEDTATADDFVPPVLQDARD